MSTPNGLRRHLEGWQAGLLALVLAGSAILLAAPRGVEPVALPQPHVDSVALARVMAHDDELARVAAATELDVDVRALGREIRLYNDAAALATEDDDFARARQRVTEAASKVGRLGADLEKLRAYQMVRFLEELRAWQRTGVTSDELRALSGDFLEAIARSRWCIPETRELVVGERELRVLFKKRWNTMVGADGEPLLLTADEERVRVGFLVHHPFVNNDAGSRGVSDPAALERLATPQRMKLLDRLATLDPGYPVELARGIVLYRVGHYQPAADAFRRHLEARPDGPYALHARNFMKAALDQSPVPLP
jgi:hypothetical protein